jgi:hypothetical protein
MLEIIGFYARDIFVLNEPGFRRAKRSATRKVSHWNWRKCIFSRLHSIRSEIHSRVWKPHRHPKNMIASRQVQRLFSTTGVEKQQLRRSALACCRLKNLEQVAELRISIVGYAFKADAYHTVGLEYVCCLVWFTPIMHIRWHALPDWSKHQEMRPALQSAQFHFPQLQTVTLVLRAAAACFISHYRLWCLNDDVLNIP